MIGLGWGYLTWPLALVVAVLGVVMFVIGALHGGTEGMLLGVLFFAAGAGRLWLLRRRDG